jgi:mevalonate kinase
MQIRVCAPTKVILFGEHYVVYGAPGIVVAIEPYNEIEFSLEKSKTARLQYDSTLKNASFDTRKTAEQINHPIYAIYEHYNKQDTKIRELNISVRVKKAWELKGVGNSASLSACFSYALRKCIGLPCKTQDIFEDVDIGERVAHGSPSGIDAGAVCFGNAIEFRKNFRTKPSIKNIVFGIDDEYTFFLVDTYKKDKRRSNTKTMIETFAKANNISRLPNEMSLAQRLETYQQYLPIFEMAKSALKEGDIKKLANAMNKNHELLEKSNICSPSIQEVIYICKTNGAIGAKVSASGGVGGMVVGLCEKQKCQGIFEALENKGFGVHEFRIATKGVHEKIDEARRRAPTASV